MRRLLVVSLPVVLSGCFLFGSESEGPEGGGGGGSGGGAGGSGVRCASDADCGTDEVCTPERLCRPRATEQECVGDQGAFYFDPVSSSCLPRQLLAVGRAHLCAARRADYRAFCRGEDADLQLGTARPPGSGPAPRGDWREVRSDTTSGLMVDGDDGTTHLAGEVVQLAASADASCAVLRSAAASLVCWGANEGRTAGWSNLRASEGERFHRDGAQQIGASPDVSELSGVTQVALGEAHGCAVAGGKLRCWGRAWDGADARGFTPCGPDEREEWTPDGTPLRCSTRSRPVTLPDDARVAIGVSLAAGERHTCVIAGAERRLACWGSATAGWPGVTPPEGVGPVERQDRDESTLALTIPAWVEGTPDAPLDQLRLVAAGASHTCVVRGDDELICLGDNQHGQCGGAATAPAQAAPPVGPRRVTLPGTGRIEALAAGDAFTCALRDGRLFCFGDNAAGQCGLDPSLARLALAPTAEAADPDPIGRLRADALELPLGGSGPWIHLSAGGDRVCALSAIGEVTCLGPGDEAARRVVPPALVTPGGFGEGGELLPTRTRLDVEGRLSCLYRGAEVACAGDLPIGWNRTDLRDRPAGFSPLLHDDGVSPEGVEWVRAGGPAVCVGDARGASCLGHGYAGLALSGLDDALLHARLLPVSVPPGRRVVRAVPSQDEAASCLVLDDGSLHCAGQNTLGQVTPGVAPDGLQCQRPADGAIEACVVAPRPVELPPEAAGIFEVSSAWVNSCALDTAGAVWCWGLDAWPDGQTGARGAGAPIVDTFAAPSRAAVPFAAEDVEVGRDFACALETGGAERVFCWGNNSFGQLARARPAIPSALPDAPAALPVSNLPDAVLVRRPLSDVPAELTAVHELSCGRRGCCARFDQADATGLVACWGSSYRDDFADPSFLGQSANTRLPIDPDRPVALTVAGLGPAVELTCAYAIGAGEAHVCALVATDPAGTCAADPDAPRAERRLVCWGSDEVGQQGRLRRDPHLPFPLPLPPDPE